MIYRLATFEDWPAIAEFVHGFKYFMPIDPATLGGHWLIAVDDAGTVHGTLWFFAQLPQAYVDYWAATCGIVASKLGAMFQRGCEDGGIRWVRGMIAKHNVGARHLARELGMVEDSVDYRTVFRRL